ncbi:nucleotide-binding oligomerization domain-containing protein 2-like [Ptychodera flava]|uniref:nucleotide-binding oligomerization domain-containing protein 2-like n=1 Tax=Ptychodera flava TaxID=63121 RepID=UPI00396A3705
MSRINPLRRLYNFLSEQLSEEDDRSLRNLLRGDQVTTRELERLKSPAEIFIKLEESGHISKTDLVLLKELLKAIKRLPLVVEVEKVEEELQECQLDGVSRESSVKGTNLPQDVKYDPLIHSAVSASAKSTHDDADLILQCQATLRKSYKRLSHILPLPWLDGADRRLKLENIYTELDLQSSDGFKQIVQRKDIFSYSGDHENTNRILIEGDPGYGKSTFCKMIAYDWAKGETNYLRDFQLLFLFELKDLQEYHSENTGKQSLKDAIFDLVLRGVNEKEKLWSFIENNQSQVCFIFDGLDEVSSSNLPVYFKQMVQQKWPLLPDCHVIVTSRIIRDCDSKHMYDKKLSIKGLGREKVELFVKKYLKYQGSIGKADEIRLCRKVYA